MPGGSDARRGGGRRPVRTRWLHAVAALAAGAVVWWAFHWQLSALQWLGLLLIAVVLWHAVQGRGPMRPRTRAAGGVVVAAAVIAALLVDRPWQAPWWPGSTLAGGTPDPCAVGASHVADLVPGAAEPTAGGYSDLAVDWSTCGWGNGDRLLYLEYRRFPWQGTDDDSRSQTAAAFAARRDHAVPEPGTLRLGDASYRDGDGETRVGLHVRRANVIVALKYYAEPGAEALTEAERAALLVLAANATEAVPAG